MKTRRLPVVGVMGSSEEEHGRLSAPLGEWLAEQNFHLLTGGGGGVMAAVSRAFHRVKGRRGMVVGILPGGVEGGRHGPRAGYPNRWVEIAIYTHLPLSGRRGTEPMSRNHINVLSADVLVVLPGSHGTASELRLAVRYGRPAIAFVRSRRDIPGLPRAIPATDDLEEVRAFVRQNLTAHRSPNVPGYRRRKKLT